MPLYKIEFYKLILCFSELFFFYNIYPGQAYITFWNNFTVKNVFIKTYASRENFFSL